MTASALAELLELLIPHGKENAIQGRDLYSLVRAHHNLDGWNEAPPSFREVRDTIAEYLPWTCSCSTGYFFAQTAEERRATVAYLESYIRALARRRKAIIEKYQADFCGVQIELDLGIPETKGEGLNQSFLDAEEKPKGG
jgi:hypothetical protein